ncbi:cell division control protein 6 homolog [Panonychus citri]|uniref:cell division control protein 6 homolog n=1 Tax=Panonychus citri TaxID=50023 RepID=UPI0023073232|nr:cell division control protein 6 homolog [Panonychus citri]
MVVTRSAQKRQRVECASPVKNRKNVIERNVKTRTNTMMTRTTSIKTPRKCHRNLMDSFNDAAVTEENNDNQFTESKFEEIDHGLTMTPPPTPDPQSESEEMLSYATSSPECSPVKCNPIVEAKRLLSIGAVDGIIGRDTEISDLSNFLEKCLDTKESSTIFISGPPGTGKTLTVQSIITKLKQSYKITKLFYNSMDFRRGTTIYSKIADDLGLKDKTRFRDKLIESIEKFITKARQMVILTIDEIDKLDKDLVDALLDWPKVKKSKLILIGIANTITSSSLNKMTCIFEQNSVKKISFRPYSRDQIIDIIQSRLQYLNPSFELISSNALQLCARKVSSYTGDARKALDIVRQAIEMAEREKCLSNPLTGLKLTADDGDNQGSPRKMARMSPRRSPRKRLNFDLNPGKPLVEPRHISAILNSVFGNKLFSEENFTELTIHQQIILCCILYYGKERQNKEMNIPTLYKLFIKCCSKTGISSNQISNSDFLCICQILESTGLVRIKQAKEMFQTKITLSVNEDEVSQRISEKSLIQHLMKYINTLI